MGGGKRVAYIQEAVGHGFESSKEKTWLLDVIIGTCRNACKKSQVPTALRGTIRATD